MMVHHWRLKTTPDEEGNILGWTPDGKQVLVLESNKTLTSIYALRCGWEVDY